MKDEYIKIDAIGIDKKNKKLILDEIVTSKNSKKQKFEIEFKEIKKIKIPIIEVEDE